MNCHAAHFNCHDESYRFACLMYRGWNRVFGVEWRDAVWRLSRHLNQSRCNDTAKSIRRHFTSSISSRHDPVLRNPRDDLARKKARSTCWRGRPYRRGILSEIPDYESFDGSWWPWRNLRVRSIGFGTLARRIRYGGVLIGCCRNSVNAYAWSSAK